MHNLRGMFFDIGTLPQSASNENLYFVRLKISRCLTRTLYFDSQADQARCLVHLEQQAATDTLTQRDSLS
jgi:hypothetical protein